MGQTNLSQAGQALLSQTYMGKARIGSAYIGKAHIGQSPDPGPGPGQALFKKTCPRRNGMSTFEKSHPIRAGFSPNLPHGLLQVVEYKPENERPHTEVEYFTM